MALRMAQPYRHPKTGIYWFRRAVPADLRELVGKTEELRSLGTKDLAQARVRFAEISADVEARWANLRSPVRSLTERESIGLANRFYENWLKAHADDPSDQFTWLPELYEELWTRDEPSEEERVDRDSVELSEIIVLNMRRFCYKQAEYCLAEMGLKVDEYSEFKLARAIGVALQRSSLILRRLAKGEITYEQIPVLAGKGVSADGTYSQPTSLSSTSSKEKGQPSKVTITGLLDEWWKEAEAAHRKQSTLDSYNATVKSLKNFLKHDDARRVTKDDVVAFKNFRLTTPSDRTGKAASPKTVRDSDLSVLKGLFGWAVANNKLPLNPAQGVTVKVGKKPQVRLKGFTDQEAKDLLTAALNYVGGDREHHRTSAAKRWVPWLCAFTGARVGEIAQLRRQDVYEQNGAWIIRITPEAGRVKTNQFREVVLHPQIDAIGFRSFVESCSDDYLFIVSGGKENKLGQIKGLTNRLSDFSRSIVSDVNVQPNHGWRHRFTTLCRNAEINERVFNAIQGHTEKTMADRYGDVTIEAKASAVLKLPWVEIDS